ncbi:LOW QUALITY PROTEIN: P3 protein [Macrochelys suwanniensis]
MAQALSLLLLGCWAWLARGQPAGTYLSMGDGSTLEFDFPERSRGIMVVSSRYLGAQRDSGQPGSAQPSLAPAVLTVENVSTLCCGAGGFVVAIRSGLAGLAPLRLRLLDRHQLVEERDEFRVRVLPGEEPEHPGLGHFSENPLLYALLPLIFVNKCAFGCKVELRHCGTWCASPHPVLLGILGQFVAMPLDGYLMSLAFALPKALALGLVVTCSSPGWGGGYLYSLLLGGDVTLAISMTLLSTVAAAGLMPLSSALYGQLLSAHQSLTCPFAKILATLLFIAVLSAGLLVKCKLPRVARLLLLLIKPFSFALILGGLFMAYHMGAFILADVRPPVVLAGLSVPLFGLLLGSPAACLRLPGPHRRTVSIEVGVQNSLLALAVLQLSFRRRQARLRLPRPPFVVALSSTAEMLLLVLGHLLYKKLRAASP